MADINTFDAFQVFGLYLFEDALFETFELDCVALSFAFLFDLPTAEVNN
jgi:hypothetical protein